jgi:hypothetical protein
MTSGSANSERVTLLQRPWFWIILVGVGIWWVSSGFPPFGFPSGEYVCESRSGVQEHPISVYPGTPMKVIEYQPGQAVDVSSRMSYSHSLFSSHLNLYLDGETYYCQHRG